MKLKAQQLSPNKILYADFFLGLSAPVHHSAPVPAFRLYLRCRYRCNPAAFVQMEHASAVTKTIPIHPAYHPAEKWLPIHEK